MNYHDKLKQVVDRKDRTGYANKDMPEDLRIQMDTFFENARLMAEYKLDTIPGEVLANLTRVMKWITTTSYDLEIVWIYNGKQTKEKKNTQADNGRVSYTYNKGS